MTIAGSMYGLAFGDAMGAPTEFASYKSLKKIYGRGELRELPGRLSRVARVTDDTQMGMAVARAITSAAESGFITTGHLTNTLETEFIRWYLSPDNTADRAPGGACMLACQKLSRGLSWWQATKFDAKGCGANMRVTPVGLADWLTPEQRSGIAQLQAAVTHWHPTALAAADVTQYAVHVLLHGAASSDLLDLLLDYTDERREWDPREWIGEILDDRGNPVDLDRALEWTATGWNETRDALLRVQDAWNLSQPPSPLRDPCLVGGAGWVAEEALATAVHSFLLFPDDAPGAVMRAAFSSGDSDSIAALAGAFAGAAHGVEAFPVEWLNRIEYVEELEVLSRRLA